MKKLLIVCILLVSCGQPSQQIVQESCTIVQNGNNVTLTCPNGSTATFMNSTMVQFCPGTAVYPSSFPEVGICLNNQIYAVYSVNSGFLTLIPPGNYSSNAVGSSCNFTVLPNCQIQN